MLALIALVGWDYRRGPLSLVTDPKIGTVVDVLAGVCALVVAIFARRHGGSWWHLAVVFYVGLWTDSWLALLLLVSLYALWARSAAQLPFARSVALVMLLTALSAVHEVNLNGLGGDELGRLCGYVGLVTIAVTLLDEWIWDGRIIVNTGAGMGPIFLLATGLALKLKLPEAAWFETKNAHAIAGIYCTPFLLSFVWRHVVRRETTRRPLATILGTIATLIWLGVLITGLNRVATGGNGYAPTQLHWWLVVAGVAAVALHLALASRTALRKLRASGLSLATRLAGAAVCCVAAVVLAVWPTQLSLPPFRYRGELPWSREDASRLLANPRTGLTASSVAGLGIPRALLVPEAHRPGCTNALACHARELKDWSESSHRYSANPAYRLVVGQLVREEGVAAARLCASCHDPVALLAGEMIDGSEYPQRHSAGVSCIVCHTSRAVGGVPVGNGRFRLSTVPLLHHLLGPAATQTMMIYESPAVHFNAIADEHLRGDEMCGTCHLLEINGVELRNTFGDFRTARLVDPKGEPVRCRSCHMPLLNIPRDEVPHDHRMLGGNVAISAMGGASVQDRVQFMAQALILDGSLVRDDGVGRWRVRLELTNRGSGHGFPTAPLDLVQYWFELRSSDEPNAPWQRLGSGSLFGERLYDRAGNLLTGHELWKVGSVEHEGERIPVGGQRVWDFLLPANAASHRLEVRLLYQRYPSALASALREQGAMVDAVEVLRRELASPLAANGD